MRQKMKCEALKRIFVFLEVVAENHAHVSGDPRLPAVSFDRRRDVEQLS